VTANTIDVLHNMRTANDNDPRQIIAAVHARCGFVKQQSKEK
jgi:hypothetical protein